MNPALLGLIRGAGVAAIIGALTYLGNADNLSGLLNPTTASLAAMVLLAIEHTIEGNSGKALFGLTSSR